MLGILFGLLMVVAILILGVLGFGWAIVKVNKWANQAGLRW